MIKLRDAGYCNLKFFLTFLVIYGHLIEPDIWDSYILMVQYRWIYLVHMPLFSFLSGLFVNREKDCRAQLVRVFPLYILSQTAAVLLGNGTAGLLTPWWHLWYLLSDSVWLGSAWLWFRFCRGKHKLLILVCSIAAGCLAGLVPFIERGLSLSRTLVFFPYFWAGVFLPPSCSWKKLRPAGFAAFAAALVITPAVGSRIPVGFLYQASPYESENGMALRLICYLLGGSLGLFLLTASPIRRFPFSKMGANTMPAYLLHAPIILCLRGLEIPRRFDFAIAAAILCMTYTLTKWHGTLYGIIPERRRDRECRHFRASMKTMLSRSIDSSYP